MNVQAASGLRKGHGRKSCAAAATWSHRQGQNQVGAWRSKIGQTLDGVEAKKIWIMQYYNSVMFS